MKQSDGFVRLWPTVITMTAMLCGAVGVTILGERTTAARNDGDTHHCRTGDDEAEQC
jgi:hypothetical protein